MKITNVLKNWSLGKSPFGSLCSEKKITYIYLNWDFLSAFGTLCLRCAIAPSQLTKLPHPWLVKLSTSNLRGRQKYFSIGSSQPKQCLGANVLGCRK